MSALSVRCSCIRSSGYPFWSRSVAGQATMSRPVQPVTRRRPMPAMSSAGYWSVCCYLPFWLVFVALSAKLCACRMSRNRSTACSTLAFSTLQLTQLALLQLGSICRLTQDSKSNDVLSTVAAISTVTKEAPKSTLWPGSDIGESLFALEEGSRPGSCCGNLWRGGVGRLQARENRTS